MGAKKGCVTLAGRMKTNVKDAIKKKVQRNNCINLRAGRKSKVRSQRNQGNGSKEQEHQRKNGTGEESHPFKWMMVHFSGRKWDPEKHIPRVRKLSLNCLFAGLPGIN